ncbi:MAG: S4 domain-containing protein [Xanthobacteraceae bacterium]
MDRQRIDKWLWHARVVRTRSAASALAASGHVRVNGERVTMPSRGLRIDDVVTVALDRRVRVLKVAGFTERRGGSEAGRALYADLTPAPGSAGQTGTPPIALREPGAGRPTKRERRAVDRLRRGEE